MPSHHHHHQQRRNEEAQHRQEEPQNNFYSRDHRRQANYRRNEASSSRHPFESQSNMFRAARDADWRANDGYRGDRRDEFEAPRESESWPGHDSRQGGPVMTNRSGDHRNGHQDRWHPQDDRPSHKGRQGGRQQSFEHRREWANHPSRGRATAWDGQWDSSREPKAAEVVRAWEPAPGWQDRQEQRKHENPPHENSSKSSYNGSYGGNSSSNRHYNEGSQLQRDWRSDDGGNPNNWSKRGNNSDTGYVPASRRRARSRTPSRSRSRSPTGSFYSRRSSRGRTRSPSSSPASKRRKTYENADDEHDSDRPQGWVPHKEDTSHLPLNAIKSIWPPPQDTSSNGSRRSPGRSESPRSLPPSTSITSAPSEADTHNGIDRNGSGSYNGSSRHQVSEPLPAHMSMPPPTIIPAPHAEFVPPPTLTRPLAPARFVTKNAGFRPIGQASSSLKKFFPSDEEDMDLSSDPVIPPAADGGTGSAAAAAEPVTPVVVSEDAGAPPSEPATPQEQYHRSELYAILSQVGEGTFGKVYKAQNTVTGKYVALKRIRMESEKEGFPVTAMREIKLLQSLRHENVVRLYEMMVSNGSVYMVFEYMDHDLTGILSQTQFAFTDAHLKSFNHQMLAGLAYLHHKGVIHRDIKGSNILVNNRGELKLGDFGLARFYQKRRRSDYTNRVITLWYRPPELLFGATVYGPEIDMWSAGCIMLELFTKKPVFQGQDEIHQLTTIYKVIGTPTPERWPELAGLPWYELIKPQSEMPNRFRDMFARWMKPAALDLAGRLLCYNPLERATAAQALEAPYFVQEEPVAEAPTGLSALKGEWHELDSKRERAKRKRKE